MQEIKKESVSSNELNPDIKNIGINVCSDYMHFGVLLPFHCQTDWSGFDDDYFELPNGDFVKVDDYLESLMDECDRKEVLHVD